MHSRRFNLNLAHLSLKLLDDDDRNDNSERQDDECQNNDEGVDSNDGEGGVNVTHHCRDQSEDDHRPDNLPLQVGGVNEQTLSEIGKREQQRQVEQNSLDNIHCCLLRIGIGFSLVTPCSAGVCQESIVAIFVERFLRCQQELAGVLVHLAHPRVFNPVSAQFLDSVFVQNPHVLCNFEGGEVNGGRFTHQEALAKFLLVFGSQNPLRVLEEFLRGVD